MHFLVALLLDLRNDGRKLKEEFYGDMKNALILGDIVDVNRLFVIAKFYGKLNKEKYFCGSKISW